MSQTEQATVPFWNSDVKDVSIISTPAWHSQLSFPSGAPHSSDVRAPSSAHRHLTPSNPPKWHLALQPTLALLGANPAQYGQPDPHYPSVPRPGSGPPSLLDATRVLLCKGRPSGPVPRGSPLPHPAITAPMRYSSNRQKVLRFCGAMVPPSRPPVPLRRLTSPSGGRLTPGSLSCPAAATGSAPLPQLPLSGRAGEQPGVGQSPPGTSHAAAPPQPIRAVHFTSEAARAATQTAELQPWTPTNGKRKRQRFAPPGSA